MQLDVSLKRLQIIRIFFILQFNIGDFYNVTISIYFLKQKMYFIHTITVYILLCLIFCNNKKYKLTLIFIFIVLFILKFC